MTIVIWYPLQKTIMWNNFYWYYYIISL